MSLVTAERRRLFKRRFTKWMLVIGVLILTAIAVGMFFANQKRDANSLAEAQRRADEQYTQMVRQLESEKAACERSAATTGKPDPNRFPPDCEMLQPPTREQAANPEWFLAPTFDFKRQFGLMLVVWTAIVAMCAFVIGASYVGAEWNSGGMMNLLLWRPRRLQVFATKLGTLLGGLLAVALVLGAAWTGVFWLIATYRGTTAKMTPGTWESLALTGARGIGLILIAGAVGFAVASLGRHTAMALGAAIVLIVVFQFGLGIALSIAAVRFPEAYLLPTYIGAWMLKSVTLEDWRSCNFSGGECRPNTMEITWQDSALLFGITATLLIALAAWAMRKRDIT
jgi:hypothetical protein